MKWTHQEKLAAFLASDRTCDGRYLIGVVTTGIYCLPSCTARKPKVENVRFFDTPEQAVKAGLRACKRCRPDDFYAGRDRDAEALAAGLERLRRRPGDFVGVEDLAEEVGVSASKLHGLCLRHHHQTPGRLITAARVEAAQRALLESDRRVSEIAFEVGFDGLSSFGEAFARRVAMSPLAYRRLRGARELTLRLPAGLPLARMLAHLGRDANSRTERVGPGRYEAGAWLDGAPARLCAVFERSQARVTIETAAALPERAAAEAHAVLSRRLGLGSDPRSFETHVAAQPDLARLIIGRRGLRLPLFATAYESLVWAILGQQVTLSFAMTMMARVVEQASPEVPGGLRAPARPAAVAAISPSVLAAAQLSRSKIDFVLGVSSAIAAGELPLDALGQGSALEAEARLLAMRGLGPWTVGYVLLRGLGFGDSVPVGDAGLTRSLQTFFSLAERPDVGTTRALMSRFAPHRSLATFHLWQRLEDSP